MSLFYVYMYALHEVFFVRNVVRLYFCVNCVYHVYFTIKLLTYLLTLSGHVATCVKIRMPERRVPVCRKIGKRQRAKIAIPPDIIYHC